MHDETAYRPMNDKLASSLPNGSSLNVYGLAPLEAIEPRPPVVYHATETKIAQELDSLRPSDGSSGFPDTEGKIHVCATLAGNNTSAAHWVQLLASAKGLNVADYSILQASLANLPASARVYRDLHSESGIVIDRVALIPITDTFRQLRGDWISA
jgi:hypothetical protein